MKTHSMLYVTGFYRRPVKLARSVEAAAGRHTLLAMTARYLGLCIISRRPSVCKICNTLGYNMKINETNRIKIRVSDIALLRPHRIFFYPFECVDVSKHTFEFLTVGLRCRSQLI
jgi:hypothetical protein